MSPDESRVPGVGAVRRAFPPPITRRMLVSAAPLPLAVMEELVVSDPAALIANPHVSPEVWWMLWEQFLEGAPLRFDRWVPPPPAPVRSRVVASLAAPVRRCSPAALVWLSTSVRCSVSEYDELMPAALSWVSETLPVRCYVGASPFRELSTVLRSGVLPSVWWRPTASMLTVEDRVAVLCSEALVAPHSFRRLCSDADAADAHWLRFGGSAVLSSKLPSHWDELMPLTVLAALRPGLARCLFTGLCAHGSVLSPAAAAVAVLCAPWRSDPLAVGELVDAVSSLSLPDLSDPAVPELLVLSRCRSVPEPVRAALAEVLDGACRCSPMTLRSRVSRRCVGEHRRLLSSSARLWVSQAHAARFPMRSVGRQMVAALPHLRASWLDVPPPVAPAVPAALVECCGTDPGLWRLALELSSGSGVSCPDLVELVSACR